MSILAVEAIEHVQLSPVLSLPVSSADIAPLTVNTAAHSNLSDAINQVLAQVNEQTSLLTPPSHQSSFDSIGSLIASLQNTSAANAST